MDVEILFHTESNFYGSHGEIVVSHIDKGYVHKRIRFAFKGMVAPPALTPTVLSYLFLQAEEKGYIPFELARYGVVCEEPEEATQDVVAKDTPVHINGNRLEYMTALQNGYPHTYERWKKDKVYYDSKEAFSSTAKRNSDHFEKQLQRQKEAEESNVLNFASPSPKMTEILSTMSANNNGEQQ